ncbi:MAG: type IA DNA topoisomerase [Lachnospiraceae bacterium]|nr:type IA DNA topoisomerase [Lachnospiraceae bacterium]
MSENTAKKALFIAEKPSVAREFAKALKYNMRNCDGYMESNEAVITWCVGHLVTMSYPEVYREELKRWSFQTLPFIPEEYLYEVIPASAKQFQIVSGLLNRSDIDTIYVCTDSGREGEYIYRLVEKQANVTGKNRKRVWIDSQTEEEIQRGIREAKDLSAYDDLSNAAYLRAQEDYLMGINFSRVLTLKYGQTLQNYLKAEKRTVIAVGRVMTCVLGMVVLREREIRNFTKTPFYRVAGDFEIGGRPVSGEWKAVEGSKYFESPLLYKENGFKERKDAVALIEYLGGVPEGEVFRTPGEGELLKAEKKTEKKNAPLLYNLAELQNICSKFFKISPDETLKIAQELYEKKLTTYPRTDARVLSTAVAKVIHQNIRGLCNYATCAPFAQEVLQNNMFKGLEKTRYVNDKQITDHYAIIPTGQGFGNLGSLSHTSAKVYELIVRRFLAIFYPPQVFQKMSLTIGMDTEKFFTGFKVQQEEGWQKVMKYSFFKDKADKKNEDKADSADKEEKEEKEEKEGEEQELACDPEFLQKLAALKKGTKLPCVQMAIKEGETKPPTRYNSGSLILAMENAGQLIEDEEMRAMIKGSGIGTSATRAGILEKLVRNQYLALNKKTQIFTPTQIGEMIFDVVRYSIGSMLNPKLTASWEMGLSGVADGSISKEEYTQKLNRFVTKHTEDVKERNYTGELRRCFDYAAAYYKPGKGKAS